MRSIEAIASDIQEIKNQLYDEAVKWKEIDDKSGEQIIATLASVTMGAVGYPIQLPKELSFASLGVWGIFLSSRKMKKLKPIQDRILQLKKKLNELQNEFDKVVAIKQSETLEGGILSDEVLQGLKKASERSTDTNTTKTSTYWAIGVLFLVACYIYYKNKQSLY